MFGINTEFFSIKHDEIIPETHKNLSHGDIHKSQYIALLSDINPDVT